MKMGKIHCITSLRLRPLSNLSGSHRLCLPVELRPTATPNLSHSPQPPNFTAQSHLPSCKPWPPLGRFFLPWQKGTNPFQFKAATLSPSFKLSSLNLSLLLPSFNLFFSPCHICLSRNTLPVSWSGWSNNLLFKKGTFFWRKSGHYLSEYLSYLPIHNILRPLLGFVFWDFHSPIVVHIYFLHLLPIQAPLRYLAVFCLHSPNGQNFEGYWHGLTEKTKDLFPVLNLSLSTYQPPPILFYHLSLPYLFLILLLLLSSQHPVSLFLSSSKSTNSGFSKAVPWPFIFLAHTLNSFHSLPSPFMRMSPNLPVFNGPHPSGWSIGTKTLTYPNSNLWWFPLIRQIFADCRCLFFVFLQPQLCKCLYYWPFLTISVPAIANQSYSASVLDISILLVNKSCWIYFHRITPYPPVPTLF